MKNSDSLDTNSKKSKLTEKSFLQSIAVSVFGILLCLVALCSVTWAWYSVNIVSSGSITAANCNVRIEITPAQGDVIENSESNQDLVCDFVADTEYSVKISATGTASSAYCIVYFGDPSQPYYTESIEINGEALTFKLSFEQDTQVKILARWGLASQSTVTFVNGGVYTVGSDNTPSILNNQENNE